MFDSLFGERLPGTPEEDLDALFPPPPPTYSVELDEYAPATEPDEKPEDYEPQPPPGWVDIDVNRAFLSFGDKTVIPLVPIAPGKLALSRRVEFKAWGGGQTIPVGVHMRTIVDHPMMVNMVKGRRPFNTSDFNTSGYIKLDINWMNILKAKHSVFCIKGPETTVTGGGSAPATLECIARRIANAYLTFIRIHSALPKEADPTLGHVHFSQLYLAGLYTYDSQTYHADVRVVYPYTPPPVEDKTEVTGMPVLQRPNHS